MSLPEQNNSAFKKNYGFSAISRSLVPFFIGKGVRLVVTVSVILLLARFLNQAEYAVYISLQAFVTIVGALSSVGVQQAMLRYIPELRASGNSKTMYWLFSRGMAWRFFLLSVVLLLSMPLVSAYGGQFGLENWLWIVPWYALVGLLRLTALSLSLALEALLWQKPSQYGMAIGGFARLVGIVAVVKFSTIDLWAVVLIEICSEAIALILMMVGWYIKRAKDEHKDEGTDQWWPENKKRVFRFGAWCGLLNQTRLLYGSSPNRLMTARFLGGGDLALFGFADSLNNLAMRLMPTYMMMSMVRPIFLAHYTENKDFQYIAKLSDLVNRLNLSLLALPTALLLVVGEPLLSWATAGKYGAAAYLLAGFLGVMLFDGMRATLELLVQTVEKNQILLTNFIQSLSIVFAIPLFPVLGLWSLIVVNVIGTMIANITVVLLLRRYGYQIRYDLQLAFLVVLYIGISASIGLWLLEAFSNYFLVGVVTALVFVAAMLIKPPLKQEEITILKSFIKNRRKRSTV